MLPIYKPNNKCPKCGYEKVSTTYCHIPPNGIPVEDCWEYMVRECLRCNYKWLECPLD